MNPLDPKNTPLTQPALPVDPVGSQGPLGQDDAAAAAEPFSQDEGYFVAQIKETADKLLKDEASRGDIKLLASVVKELRYCFKIFKSLKGTRKVTIFGSARTKPDHPAFLTAVEFGRRISEEGFLVITGAASGIMEAGHVGAGREKSIGINIRLPFEQSSNPIITGDNKLMTLRYFFTRKLLFVKECDAVVLFPGGFGTHDEGFEVLTLVQTGKSHLFPIVFLDEPNGTYWKLWQEFILKELLANHYISDSDLALYLVTDSVEEATREVSHFYRVYHSMRYVGKDLVLRLNRHVHDNTLEEIRSRFGDICKQVGFEIVAADPMEQNEEAIFHLPRLRFRFDRHQHGKLRQLIDVLNNDEL